MEYATDYIEDYLNHKLTAKAKDEFEEDLKSDPVLRDEVGKVAVLYNSFDEIQAQKLMEGFADIESGLGGAKTVKFAPQFYLKWAAAIALIAMVSTWYYLSNPTSNQELFLANYTVYPNVENPVSRSGESGEAVWLYYENGDYSKTYARFKIRVEANPPDYASWFYLGICAIELNMLPEAEKALTRVVADSTGKYQEQGQWYLALSYLKADDKAKAIEVLKDILESGKTYNSRAKELLLELQ